MPTLGDVLREARSRRALTLGQVEEATKIRKKYLQALEEEDYAALPAPVYARGFLQAYAECLGIDPAFALNLYLPPSSVAAREGFRPAASGIREGSSIPLRGFLALLLAVVGVAALFFLYSQYLTFASNQGTVVAAPTAPPTTPTAVVVLAPLPTPMPTATPRPSPTPVLGVEVVVKVTERCWLRVVADGASVPIFEGAMEVGETRTWKAKDRLDMRIGNAGAVDATVNGMRQGKLGASGEVKNVTWGRQ